MTLWKKEGSFRHWCSLTPAWAVLASLQSLRTCPGKILLRTGWKNGCLKNIRCHAQPLKSMFPCADYCISLKPSLPLQKRNRYGRFCTVGMIRDRTPGRLIWAITTRIPCLSEPKILSTLIVMVWLTVLRSWKIMKNWLKTLKRKPWNFLALLIIPPDWLVSQRFFSCIVSDFQNPVLCCLISSCRYVTKYRFISLNECKEWFG